jgi:glutathione synthase/RimK-type ligase-like ATP-grasp enzyme
MSQQNKERIIVSLLREICSERQVALASFCDDWLFELRKGDAVAHLFGYDFSLNSATARAVCKDKAATTALLAHAAVPHIPHWLFHRPEMAAYVPHSGNWQSMLRLLGTHPLGLVCKPNEGTGGQHVHHVRTPLELEAAAAEVFQVTRALSVSPYVPFEAEYRVAVLHDVVEFAYRKQRPTIIGDGKRSIRQLLLDRLSAISWTSAEFDSLSELLTSGLRIDDVPSAGARVPLGWKHNLAHGSAPELLPPDFPSLPLLAELAKQAARALGIALASVDIAEAADGFKIMEVNSGIMMEGLVAKLPQGHTLAKRFYDRIVCAALHLSNETGA